MLDAIGNTPLVQVDGIWVKPECLNPSGSIKARIARYMIERAERAGSLRPGDTIVEASSGNTGNAMSMVAALKGYRMLAVMPDNLNLSPERVAISRAFGADVMTLGDFHVTNALAKTRELGERPGFFAPQQFDSEWNVEENRTWLGPELLRQLPARVLPDAVVAGIGTGGTWSASARHCGPPTQPAGSWAWSRTSPARFCAARSASTSPRESPTASCRASSRATGRPSTRWSPSTATRPSPRCGGSREGSGCSSVRGRAPISSLPGRTATPTRRGGRS